MTGVRIDDKLRELINAIRPEKMSLQSFVEEAISEKCDRGFVVDVMRNLLSMSRKMRKHEQELSKLINEFGLLKIALENKANVKVN